MSVIRCVSFLAVVMFLIGTLPPSGASSVGSHTAPARVGETLPLVFEENKGQFENDVRFLARGRGFNAFLTRRDTVMVLTKNSGVDGAPGAKSVLRMQCASTGLLQTCLIAECFFMQAFPSSCVEGGEVSLATVSIAEISNLVCTYPNPGIYRASVSIFDSAGSRLQSEYRI